MRRRSWPEQRGRARARCHRIGRVGVPTGVTTMPGTLPFARHYYETRREVLAAVGTHITPWHRFAPDERAVAVAEAAIVLEAVRRANEERTALLGLAVDRLATSTVPTWCRRNKIGPPDVLLGAEPRARLLPQVARALSQNSGAQRTGRALVT